MSHRRRSIVMSVSGAGLLTLCGTAWFLGAGLESPQAAAARARPPDPSVITAPVQEKRIAEEVVTRGTVEVEKVFPLEVVATSPPPGTERAVITGMPLRPGKKIADGAVVLEISGRPMFVLTGQFPAYRDLRAGDAGKDVRQLQKALTRLGFAIHDRPGFFGTGTVEAVEHFYRRRGYEPLRPASAGDGQAGGLTVPMSEVLFARTLPMTVTGVKAKVGQDAGGVFATASTKDVVVEVRDPALDQVETGVRASVEDEAGGHSWKGELRSVRQDRTSVPGDADQKEGDTAVVDPNSDAGGQPDTATTVGTVRVPGLPLSLLSDDVKVTFTVAATDGTVLAVPVSALFSAPDGSTYVTTVDASGRQQKTEVEAGLSAGGLVEITANGVTTGTKVVVGWQGDKNAAPQ